MTMDWKQLISDKRFGKEASHKQRSERRTEFQRDFDRLIFSAPFRRMQNKTQVFPLPGSIFVHNRLTHSLEVSSVGRSLGTDVARELLQKHPELRRTEISPIAEIVSAACLAHDMGNPPFGHSGEKAIRSFKIAAGNGNDYAEYQLGKIYLYGKDIPRDTDKAMYYLHLAAEHGNQYAAQLIHSIRVNGNWTAALASLRLLGHMARIIQNRLEDERRGRENSIDRKLRRKIEEKKQAHGLKQ